jgi:predicted secreted hydrolase
VGAESRLHRRRTVLLRLAALGAAGGLPNVSIGAAPPPSSLVRPGYRIRFPDDEGSHPDFRVEWWYATGWLATQDSRALGFQVTFFRVKRDVEENHPSAFAPRQLIIGHAALADPAHGRLLQTERAARTSFDLAGAAAGPLRVWLDDWSFMRNEESLRARVSGREFGFDLMLRPTQPPVLQGDAGFSRKGPRPESASYYYSLPHLAVGGTVQRGGRAAQVNGTAWLDHEWSSSYLDPQASGWDWIGINLDDGGALMAFRMRDARGGTFWAGGSHRAPGKESRSFAPGEIRFTVLRTWRSPRTGVTYPVAHRVDAGGSSYTIEPMMDDQELDSRASVGTVYWEGAVQVLRDARRIGRGYLELTGYWQRLEL